MPLQYDQTAVRALFAAGNKGWTRELSDLLNNVLIHPNDPGTKGQLAVLEPHLQGRIPVVLVHGTAASPIRLGDMINDLPEVSPGKRMAPRPLVPLRTRTVA